MTSTRKIYATLTGLPVSFTLEWPFHKSTSGADFWVLHTDIRLESSTGLHAPVAVNLSATVREVLPSLDPKDAEAPVINSLRKEVDHRQVEFLKSGKLVPVHFSSRHYSFKQKKWVFGKASEEEVLRHIERTVFWNSRLGGAAWLADPAEALYVESPPEQFLALADQLAKAGMIVLEGDSAKATSGLLARSGEFDTEMQTALSELEKKHAFERG